MLLTEVSQCAAKRKGGDKTGCNETLVVITPRYPKLFEAKWSNERCVVVCVFFLFFFGGAEGWLVELHGAE